MKFHLFDVYIYIFLDIYISRNITKSLLNIIDFNKCLENIFCKYPILSGGILCVLSNMLKILQCFLLLINSTNLKFVKLKIYLCATYKIMFISLTFTSTSICIVIFLQWDANCRSYLILHIFILHKKSTLRCIPLHSDKKV